LTESNLQTYLRQGQPYINFVHFLLDLLKTDPEYAKFLEEEKPADYEKARTWDGEGVFTFKLRGCPLSAIAIQEQKEIAGLLFNLDIGEVKPPSFLRTLSGLKQVRIIPKAKGFFGSKEISEIQMEGGGVPSLNSIMNDQKLRANILNLFKTNLIETLQINYVKNQQCMIITSVTRDLEIIEKTSFPKDLDYPKMIKQLIDVIMRMARYIQTEIF